MLSKRRLKEPVLTFFEREGEGCSYRKAYLEDGKCMDQES